MYPGAAQVLIGGKPAARISCVASCIGPTDFVKKGAPQVMIEGLAAARKGDGTAHGGCVMQGFAMVLIGGAMAPTSDAETMEDALNLIRASDFAQTEEGRKVLARLEALREQGKLSFEQLKDDRRAQTSAGGAVSVADRYNRDPDTTASELVHEGTHSMVHAGDTSPDQKKTLDEEMRTNTNQLNFYEEQRDTYRDDELEKRRKLLADGDPAGQPSQELCGEGSTARGELR